MVAPKKQKKSSGQSLIEVMIALSIVVVGTLGILSLLSQSIFISRTTQDQITATYLAEEGVEIVKNLVDHDMYYQLAYASAPGWGNCFQSPPAPLSAQKEYELDYTTTDCHNIMAFNGSGDFLDFNSSTGMYAYNTGSDWTPTIFTRKIKIGIPNNAEIVVDSIVSWQVGGSTQTVDLQDHFYNWHP